MKTTPQNIKDTKEVISLLAAVTTVLFDAKRDDDVIDLADLPKAFAIIPTISPAFDGISNVLAELKDLNTKEIDELTTHVQDKFEAVIDADVFETLSDVLLIAAAGKRIYDRHTNQADATVVVPTPVKPSLTPTPTPTK
tara:strand:- start:37290 stop:37706 length:417 start_codon:yes stop_codon:yes gene_type:complete